MWCPKCGRTEMAAHLCLCPSKDRTKLFLESTDELQDWLDQDNKTERELAYWIPKYILMRGTKNMAEMGCMSPQMTSLSKSQDIIGWKNFMEGRISRHFFEIQNEYFTLGNDRIDAEQWTRRQFTLHDKQKGWLKRKELHDIIGKIDQLRETDIDDIPKGSKYFCLKWTTTTS